MTADEAPRRRRGQLLAAMAALMAMVGAMLGIADRLDTGAPKALEAAAIAAFTLLALILALRATTNLALGRRDAALDDELSRANRARAARAGLWAMLIACAGFTLAGLFLPIAWMEVAPVLLAAGAAGATLRFVFLERAGDEDA